MSVSTVAASVMIIAATTKTAITTFIGHVIPAG
jgi:hypothetical protein